MDLKEQESAQYYGILYMCNKLIRLIIIICPRSWYVIVFKNKNTNKAQHFKQELRRDTSSLPGNKKSTGAS